MAKIRSKAVEREALQWDGTENAGYGIAAWANSHALDLRLDSGLSLSGGHLAVYQPATEAAGEKLDQYLTVLTPNGWAVVQPNEWVIIDELGQASVISPEIFENRWEVLDAEG